MQLGRCFIFIFIFSFSESVFPLEINLQCRFERNRCTAYNLDVLTDNNTVISVKNYAGLNLDFIYELRLEHQNTKFIPYGLGRHFRNLADFHVVESKLKFVQRKNFRGMTKLIWLNLNGNEIEEIPPDAFIDLKNLLELQIENNQIRELDSGLLLNLTNLEDFYASGNHLEHLPFGLFRSNLNLMKIQLRNNKLKHIDVDFSGFSRVIFVGLRYNTCINDVFTIEPEKETYDLQRLNKAIAENCTSVIN